MKDIRLFVSLIIVIVFYSCSNGKKESIEQTMEEANKTKSPPAHHPGKMIYMQFCLACHMENGQGVPGLYPPLVQTEWVLEDKERLIKIVLNGMTGPIEVNGQPYNNVMAKLDYLGDKEIAEVLSYIRSNFGNDAEAITPEEVKKVRDSGAN